MIREQYFQLKSELKELAHQIKSEKLEYKVSQKNLSVFQKANGSFIDYYEGRINSSKWETIRPEHEKLSKMMYSLQSDLKEKRVEYRLKHIVYCLARGRTMSQIEPKVAKGNEPSRIKLERLMKLYDVQEKIVA